jgi:hypothetical protein
VDPQTQRIQDVKFKTFGCGSAIASSSYLTELVRGMTLEDAGKIRNTQIAKELCLPPVKLHCSMLAEDAIKSAISNYYVKNPKARKTDLGSASAPIPKIEIEQVGEMSSRQATATAWIWSCQDGVKIDSGGLFELYLGVWGQIAIALGVSVIIVSNSIWYPSRQELIRYVADLGSLDACGMESRTCVSFALFLMPI